MSGSATQLAAKRRHVIARHGSAGKAKVEQLESASADGTRGNRSAKRVSRAQPAKRKFLHRMKLHINGDEKTFDSPITLAALVETLGMKSDRVAVELNREIAPRATWAETTLNEGDRLEIVHFVGGGSAKFVGRELS